MNCILVRHGIAVEQSEWKKADADRPLSDKGLVRTRKAARGLMRLGIVPTHILTSPLVRARDTARLIQESFEDPPSITVCEELLPKAPAEKLATVLHALPAEATVICVGHEPQLSYAAGVLLVGQRVPGLRFKKAGACLIVLPERTTIARGRLRWWLAPRQLRSLRGRAARTPD